MKKGNNYENNIKILYYNLRIFYKNKKKWKMIYQIIIKKLLIMY